MYRVTLINDNIETIIHSEINAPNAPHLSSGIIRLAINKIDTFEFTILPNNPGYNLIRPLITLVQVLNTKTGKMEFDGRVLMPVETMDEEGLFSKTFICEGELGYLNDSAQRHGEYHNISVRDFLQVIIDNHNADVANDPIDKTFEVGIVEVDSSTGTLYRYLGYEKTFDEIQEKLISRLGGELVVRKENGIRYLDYVVEYGKVKETEIRLEKNLKSIEKEVDPTEIITRLVPLGERIESDDPEAVDASQARLTIESVNDGKDYIEDEEAMALFGVITKSHVWDDITVPSILKTRGEQFLKENNRVKEKHEVSALDLALIGLDPDEFELGNYHPLINPVMGIDDTLRIVEKVIDIISPENNSLALGDTFKTASEYQAEANKSQRHVIELQSIVNSQSQRIRTLLQELNTVNDEMTNVVSIIEGTDLEELPDAISALEQAITDLNNALDDIPVYDLVTHTQDGLMASADKIKLDSLQNYSEATEVTSGLMSAEDKQKLNRITVTQNIDLDDLLARIEALETQ